MYFDSMWQEIKSVNENNIYIFYLLFIVNRDLEMDSEDVQSDGDCWHICSLARLFA